MVLLFLHICPALVPLHIEELGRYGTTAVDCLLSALRDSCICCQATPDIRMSPLTGFDFPQLEHHITPAFYDKGDLSKDFLSDPCGIVPLLFDERIFSHLRFSLFYPTITFFLLGRQRMHFQQYFQHDTSIGHPLYL